MALGACAALAALGGSAYAAHLAIDTAGHTTLEQILAPTDPGADYTTLSVEQVDEEYLLRDGATEPGSGAPAAQAGREGRRVSLAYLGQMTDFQLADEESPARVEFLDANATSAWRPWEALTPFMIDASVRQMNRFVPASPVPEGDGGGTAMDLALMTGDQADNQQRNETIWVRELLEGNGQIRFNSGSTDPADYQLPTGSASCDGFVLQEGGPDAAAAEGGRYTGVQDYDDYPPVPGPNTYFYDPDQPTASWQAQGWPTYTGLMDRAQALELTPAGLDVPFYVTNGNHDVLVQGNEDANEAFEDIALGCFKAIGTTASPSDSGLQEILENPSAGMLVPPDELRRFVSKPQIKTIFAENDPVEQHGFGFVDPAENAASNGSASYYAWDPPQTPAIRFISIDTNSEGGVAGPFGPQPTGSSDGNLDDPQFQWLESELEQAEAEDKIVVLFGHHPVRTMDSTVPDEAASPCTGQQHDHGDNPEHDRNPGCDLDPRPSEPLHYGTPEQAEEFGSTAETFTELVGRYPNAIAYVSGHTHENQINAFSREGGGVWWEIGTSAVADWPTQHRLIEVMDNRDGTLSIFGTVLDHASPGTAPASGDASGFGRSELASIARTFAYNDPQAGDRSIAEGDPEDRNVELLVDDPRQVPPGRVCAGRPANVVGTAGDDTLVGTPGDDVIIGRGGNDDIRGRGGDDLICGRRGDDTMSGGPDTDTCRGGLGQDVADASCERVLSAARRRR